MAERLDQPATLPHLPADSDESAQAFRYDCAQDSDLKPPCPVSLSHLIADFNSDAKFREPSRMLFFQRFLKLTSRINRPVSISPCSAD